MQTSAGADPVRAALGALVDYAGLFPPAELRMPDAVAAYDAARGGPYAWMLGRFIVPASRLAELSAAIGDRETFPVSAVIDADCDARRWFDSAQRVLADVAHFRDGRLRVETLEAALPPLLTARDTYDATLGQFGGLVARAGLRDLPAFAEIPRHDGWIERLPAAMAAASRAHLGAKLRCGGIVAEAFPSVEEVAAFVDAAATEHVPFKATAGLHHPVRHVDEATGFPMHGFLNLLAAGVLAHRVDAATIATIVAEEDPSAFVFSHDGFAWRDDVAETGDVAAARAADFVAYGSCSFDEPVNDLIALGILERR